MKPIATIVPANIEACTGHCQGCGKIHIKIFGAHNASSRLLAERVRLALESSKTDAKVLEIADPLAIEANGIRALPTLMIEGKIVLQGEVPSVTEIARLMKNKDLFQSKLFQLHTLSVGVDMSEVSANALGFAWKIAHKMDCNLEIVYAMDSIFEGTVPSASGFLSSYTKTMQSELDTFITGTMGALGVKYTPPGRFDGEPGGLSEDKNKHPHIASKVIYGAPDVALTEYSRHTDLLVLGATGRGGLGKRLFGSVSIEVSRSAHCPVMFVSKEAEFRGFDNVLYASDFDSLNELSVQQTVSFAERFDAQIHFVHVGPGGEKDLDAQRERFEHSFEASGYNKPFIFSKMVSDDIVGAIYEYAFYHRIELLVFVTHHRAFWDNILHKSVTNEVLSTSNIPILVIHSDGDLA
ncbi:MAG: universal stress protein [Saprospiraceae bacterium]|nr:universal stress protein [Saprospiraceae bacterium]